MLVNCGMIGNIRCQRTLGFITSFPDNIPSLDIIVTSYSTISELINMFIRSKLQSTYLLNEPSDPKVFCVSFLLKCFGPETNIQLLASTTWTIRACLDSIKATKILSRLEVKWLGLLSHVLLNSCQLVVVE